MNSISEPSKPASIHIYEGCFSSSVNVDEIAGYIQQTLPGIQVHTHEEFIRCHALQYDNDSCCQKIDRLAEQFAKLKIIDPRKINRTFEPLWGEIDYEKRRLLNFSRQPSGLLYDGQKLLEIYNSLLPDKERGIHAFHLVLTNQLFGTWNPDDLQYHARTSIYGIPCIISTTGLVEAPAKSRHYYLARQMGLSEDALEKQYGSHYLAHDDPRLTEVVKGYVMQSLFYHIHGDPFCSDPNCRLYNTHWQHELIHAQIESPCEFCPVHTAALNSMGTAY